MIHNQAGKIILNEYGNNRGLKIYNANISCVMKGNSHHGGVWLTNFSVTGS